MFGLFLCILCFGVLLCNTHGSLVVGINSLASNPLVRNSSDPDLLRRLRALAQDVQDNGCSVNLCFALQGDGFITEQEFSDQRNFVELLVAILTTDQPGGLCAVQYGETTFPISPLTDDRINFIRRLRNVSQVGGIESDISGALAYGGFQLRAQEGDANKLILFGDGFETVNAAPEFIAQSVRRDGTDICAVAVGLFSVAELTKITGDPNRVLGIGEFFNMAEIVDTLVRQVCNLNMDSA